MPKEFFFVRNGNVQLHNGGPYRPFTLLQAMRLMRKLKAKGNWPTLEYAS